MSKLKQFKSKVFNLAGYTPAKAEKHDVQRKSRLNKDLGFRNYAVRIILPAEHNNRMFIHVSIVGTLDIPNFEEVWNDKNKLVELLNSATLFIGEPIKLKDGTMIDKPIIAVLFENLDD